MLTRSIPLILGLILGIAAGLLYGWVIRPVESVESGLQSLRQDYRAEFVLSVAEAYAGNGDLQHAAECLELLNPNASLQTEVILALDFAKEKGFSDLDLERLTRLKNALSSESIQKEDDQS